MKSLSSDICGPFSTARSWGYRYFISFVDDYSRYVYIRLIRKKSEALDEFQFYVRSFKNKDQHDIQTFRSDNGGEYTSNAFDDFLKMNGIRRSLTTPYTPNITEFVKD